MNADTLTVDAFLSLLAPYANRDMLAPSEASSLQLKIAELVLDHTIDIPLLKFLSRFLTQSAYDELVEERNIEHQCGYPLCNKSPQHKVRRLSHGSNGSCIETSTRYQIWNRKPSMILPNTYLSQYCCKEHYQASMFYRNQLSQEAVFSRKDITIMPPFAQVNGPWYENNITCLEEVLAKHKELREQGKTISEVIAMMSGLSVGDGSDKDTTELAKLIEDFDIVEHEDGSTLKEEPQESDKEAASRGIDGYITSNHSLGGYMV
ncbi:hypothetical protein FDK38_000323 [Candidozyma auris]|nr:hypothetical protein FDK38_000323 [[Candida] auris]